ncbi:MAG: endopeptidase La [Flavobacteriales bacterium]|nr:endopeptidase La [Flavobacteriales bacterium]
MQSVFDFQNLILRDIIEDDAELIPLITSEEDEDLVDASIPEELPILTLRNTVLFPGVVIPITVGRDKSIKLVQDAYKGTKNIAVVSQKNIEQEDPGPTDINLIGTVGHILKILRMPDGNTTVIIQGKKRCQITNVLTDDPYFVGKIEKLSDKKPKPKNKEFKALVSSLKDLSLKIIKDSPNIPSDASFAIKNIESESFLINFIASNMTLTMGQKQKLVEENDLKIRATKVLELLSKEMQMLEIKNQIQSKVKVDLDQQQKEYFLNQQLKTIQEELGGSATDQEINELKKKAGNKKWEEKVEKHFFKELEKLQRINPQAAEYSVYLNYLELLVDLPWNEYTEDIFDLKRAQKILNRDHYGLDEVKDRILEHLAVLKLKKDMKAPILCLYGPPGVGKTSLGKSIAEAIGRKYIRMSLGGLRDEAEIRGHRKTYIGAMPGRIIQNIKKVNSANPVFILDELDKIARDAQGDPSSALLETLDPEQNDAFYDNFVEQDFDLSKVMFIATCNSLNTIQPALRDRLEIIEVTGYTIEEKVEIAKRHLVPKQLEAHGLTKSHMKFGKKILTKLVEGYTRESGVRSLEKKIAKVVRSYAKAIAMEEPKDSKISESNLITILGPSRDRDKYQGNEFAGVVTGLAWTAVGGDILFIEVSLSKGKGKFTVTGNLGNVMKESTTLAMEYLRSHAADYDINPDVFDKWNVHVHVPEGATPKDGPSAGITMLTALASAFTQRKVKARTAMTGEITLRGKVLPVGGIKEKILAAKRAEIKDIIVSVENKHDVEKIGPDYLKGLRFHYVKNADEVLKIALQKQKVDNALEIK